MAALNVTIYIGDLRFDQVKVNSVNTVEEVSIIGSELSYDTMEAVIYYDWHDTGTDIRNLVYGTEVRYYVDTKLEGKFYLDTISRQSKIEYHINCVSGIGLLDTKAHIGGLYTGQTFSYILSTIIGSSFIYTVDPAIADSKIYGWLPLDTARNNLRQLLFAQNVHIILDNNKDPVFTTFNTDSYTYINSNDIYNEGSEDLLQLATKIDVTEHAYYYLPGTSEVELFNNSNGYYVTEYLVAFDNAPIYVPSIEAEEGLRIISADLNYAVVSGRGVLKGIPYTHRTFNVVRNCNPTAKDYEISVSDVTLVSIANSANIAERLTEYYSSRLKVSADIRYNSELCGKRYRFTDAFIEYADGFLSRIEKTASSFIKAHCEFISHYSGGPTGNNYDNCVILTSTTDAVWAVPEGVKSMRVILIGAGSGGSSGIAGETPDSTSGGKGGKGGVAGKSGRIYQVEILSPAESYSYKCGLGGAGGATCTNPESWNPGLSGEETQFGIYTSYTGAASDGGFCESLISNTIYALPGKDGLDGGSGGNGGSIDTSNIMSNEGGEDGEVLYPSGMKYNTYDLMWGKDPGEKPPEVVTGAIWGQDDDHNLCYHRGFGGSAAQSPVGNGNAGGEIIYYVDACGGGGGGPTQDVRFQYPTEQGPDGEDAYSGGAGEVTYTGYTNDSEGSATIHYVVKAGRGGKGFSALDKPAATIYGCGGDAGNGGGGGGGMGAVTTAGSQYTVTSSGGTATVNIEVNETPQTYVAYGGNGGAGGAGAQGCVIIYY